MSERDNRGDFTVSTDGILSSGTLGERSNGIRRFVILPSDRCYRAWEIILNILVVYTFWVSIFGFGFLDGLKGPLLVTDNIVDVFYVIDILLTFLVPYHDETTKTLNVNLKRIAWKYMSTFLVFDIISTIPLDVIKKMLPPSFQPYGLLLRLLRFRRIYTLFVRLEKDSRFNYFWVRYAKLIFFFLFAVHCNGCFYNFLAAQHHDPKNTWIGPSIDNFLETSISSQYMTSMYWSFTTLSSFDNEYSTHNTSEKTYIIFLALCKEVLIGYLTANMTELVIHETRRNIKCRDDIQEALNFAQKYQLSASLKDQMVAYLSTNVRKEGPFPSSLPKGLRSSILKGCFYDLVKKVYLFRGVSEEELSQLVFEIEFKSFIPNEDVIVRNGIPMDFYILVDGVADLLILKNGIEEVFKEAKTGDIFGEIDVFCNKPQLFSVRTTQPSQMLRLNHTTFFNIIKANLGDKLIIEHNLLQHKEELESALRGVLSNTDYMQVLGRGDDPLLNQLFREGLNLNEPNKLDNSGRMALHKAASEGSERCVLILLNYGADPNSRDSEGNVPLWEAMLRRHEHVVKILIKKGATIRYGAVGQFACTAVEENRLDLLKEIVHNGGDITLPGNDCTALHVAVRKGNIEAVEFLLDKGAGIDQPDANRQTPRDLAEQEGHEVIKALFQSKQDTKNHSSIDIHEQSSVCYRGTFKGESSLNSMSSDRVASPAEMPVAHSSERSLLWVGKHSTCAKSCGCYPARVTVSWPGDESIKKIVPLPVTFEELRQICYQKFGFSPTKVLTKDGAEIEDIELIRDGDELVFDYGVGKFKNKMVAE